MTERVARFHAHGGPEVIQWEEVDLPAPGAGEVRFRTTAAGLNFIDTYYRKGLYPSPLPSGLGVEGAGVVEAIGTGVTGVSVGDRVCNFGPNLGAYATARNIAADALFHIPDGISDEVAAAILLKGCTTEFLVERCAKVEPGMPVLVHAAAGGVGLLLVQWLKHVGAVVIGTVGSDDKIPLARAAGADHVIQSRREDTAKLVREITNGAGVRVTFDGIGMEMWDTSLKSTGKRGLLISYGNAGGPVNGIGLATLAAHGSLFCTRPTLYHYYDTPEDRAAGSGRLFDLVAKGVLNPNIGQRYALFDVAQAHADLEARRTTGATVLLP
jgi:NADPH2:quinone reductase